MSYAIDKIREDFPTLHQEVNNKNLVYLDSAASAQKPKCVIERTDQFYLKDNAAVHRGIHHLSAQATDMMEQVRTQVQHFINAKQREEIVFVHGTTHAINLVANSYGRLALSEGDEVIITEMEHHANIVPWQLLAKHTGVKVVVWPIEEDGTLSLDKLKSLLNCRTKFVSFTHVSNVLGTYNEAKQIIALAKQQGARVLVDGAQAIMHYQVDVQDLDCDFYVFSAHKLYAPTGIGVLYGKHDLLADMPPWEGGGAMIEEVDIYGETTFNAPPWRFEAGTPNVAGIIGLGSAIEYIDKIGLAAIASHESLLMSYALEQLAAVPDLKIYGPKDKSGVIAFNLANLHAFDVGSFLDKYGVAIRTGHHCAMPLMKRYQVSGMCRASIAMYNNKADIDALVTGLKRIQLLLVG